MYWSRTLLVLVAFMAPAAIAIADVADDDYRVAMRQFSRQRWAPATTEFTAFLVEHPNDPRADDARYLLGESLVQQRRYQEARRHFTQFLQGTSQHRYRRQAQFRAAEAAYHANEHAAARTELAAFRRQYPDDPLSSYVLAYLAELALQAGDAKAAVAMFGEAHRRHPGERLKAQCAFGLAQAHERLDQPSEAIRWYGETLAVPGRYSQQATFRLAMLHYRQAAFDEAAPFFAQLVTTAAGDFLFETRYWQGMNHSGQQNWSAAVATLQTDFAAASTHRLASARTFALAEALRNLGRAEQAKAHYLTVFELDPPTEWSDDAGQILIQMAWDANDLSAVHEFADQFFARHPASRLADRAGQLKGRAFLRQEDFDAAVEIFERLVEQAPGTVPSPPDAASQAASLHLGNQYYLAIAYLGAGRPADVLRALPTDEIDSQEASELHDGLAVARASALLALGRYEQAIGPLQTYVSNHASGTDSVDCHAKLIVALAQTGQWYAAVESFELLRDRHPKSEAVVTTAIFVANLALANEAPDVAEPLFRFLAGVKPTDDDQADDGAPQAGDQAGNQAAPRERVLQGLAGLARVQFNRGSLEEASKTVERFLALSPPPDMAASLLLTQGRALEAAAQPGEALVSYEQAHQRDPLCEDASTALFAAARILASQGKRQAASQRLTQLIKQHDAFVHRDVALYQHAWLLLEIGDHAGAEGRFVELVEQYPRSPLWADAAFRLARNAADRQDVAQSNRRLEELLHGVACHSDHEQPPAGDQQPASPAARTDVGQIVCHALYLQGKLAVDTGNWLAALQSYQRIVEEHPESELAAAASFWCAEAQFQLNQFQQAEAMFAQLEDELRGLGEPGAPRQEYQAMIPLRRAQLAAQRQQWHDALAAAETIRPRFPDFGLQFEADYVIGRCLTSQARFSAARHAFRQVTTSPRAQRTETAAMAQWMIGETYFHQSNYEDAIRAYYRVDALYDRPQWQAAALLQAAKCHELSGQWSEAHQLYSQLRSEYPHTSYAAEAVRRLRVAARPRTDQPNRENQ